MGKYIACLVVFVQSIMFVINNWNYAPNVIIAMQG